MPTFKEIIFNKIGMPTEDDYQTLGLPENTSMAVIKRQYNQLVLAQHPDQLSQLSENERTAKTAKFKELEPIYRRIIEYQPSAAKNSDKILELLDERIDQIIDPLDLASFIEKIDNFQKKLTEYAQQRGNNTTRKTVTATLAENLNKRRAHLQRDLDIINNTIQSMRIAADFLNATSNIPKSISSQMEQVNAHIVDAKTQLFGNTADAARSMFSQVTKGPVISTLFGWGQLSLRNIFQHEGQQVLNAYKHLQASQLQQSGSHRNTI